METAKAYLRYMLELREEDLAEASRTRDRTLKALQDYQRGVDLSHLEIAEIRAALDILDAAS